MLNVVCVKVGNKYGPEYVNILFDMVRRNLKEGHEGKFWCLTDDPSGLDSQIGIIPSLPGITGWWAKLTMFRPGVFPVGERVLYFDLDVIITGALDDVAAYDGDFAILREFNGCEGWQSSIMAWRSGYGYEIWDKWIEQDKPEVCGGDQEWIEQVLGKADMLQDLYPKAFLSYKLQCRIGEPPRGAKVVVFHGEPKPDNCAEEWARMVWKIGGGSAAELDLVCNTADEILTSNIKSACHLDVPWLSQVPEHDGHAVIVGGGPSVKKKLSEIKYRAGLGQHIFALNNSWRYLLDNGIPANAVVMVDARADNAQFIPDRSDATFYLASQCHPEVWDKAKNLNTVLWHSYTEIIDEGLENPEKKPECLVSGGTTVGLSAMALAYALGYRKIHIYGMDSSYQDGEHHAYSQPLNDNERVLDVICHEKKFKSAAWMVAQANQFQTLALQLADLGCIITVSGDGLLPLIARNLEEAGKPDTQMVFEDGYWWPSKDKLLRNYGPSSLKGIPKLISQVKGFDVAVQAGGNVGLWPKELAKHFDRVITFEPDELNFQCLCRNCPETNIEKHSAALGEVHERKGMVRDPSNCGAHALVDGDEVSVKTIDSLNLPACDLIQLDIEGYELFALKGAEKTINRFKPTLCIELKSLGLNYGINDSATVEWLKSHGYREAGKTGRDVFFVNVETDYRGMNKENNYVTAI